MVDSSRIKESLITGITFGMTSGAITTLGLMVGLHSGTHSRLAVIGGILTIAIADAFSDALGIHISEEAENVHTEHQIWASTLATLLTKFFFALTFLVPVLVLELGTAILVAVLWGLAALAFLSSRIARSQDKRPLGVIAEHILIALVVVAATHFAGDWIGRLLR
jgi:VIT1/CCC1 family predicted Fe2+/Mn2+ transporter